MGADETFQSQLARAKNADGFLAALDQVCLCKQ